MFGKHVRKVEEARRRVHWAEEQLRQAKAALSGEPSDRLIACAAYLYWCASGATVPSFYDAATNGFMVTGAALSMALNDALAYKWIGQQEDGSLYWRDAGSTEDCPIETLAKMHPKFKK